MTDTQTLAPSPSSNRSRILALDVVRGFALCGILLVNLPPLFGFRVEGGALDFYRFYEDVVQNRFFPIFSFLFGIGFGLMWLSASERSPRPRLALLRRFVFLGILGGAHQLLQPGEALLPYALVGLVVLLPSTWIPDRFRAPLSTVLGGLLLLAGIWTGGGPALIPGLFLLGFSVGSTGALRSALRHPGRLAVAGAITACISALGFVLMDYETRHVDQWINAGLGILMAFTYVVAVLLLLRTPAEAVLRPIFSPLGRMALSNYIGATLIMVGVRFVVPDLSRFDAHGGYVAGLVLSLGILVVQVIVSTVWLRFFDQGPLEKLWRLVTWGRGGASKPHRQSLPETRSADPQSLTSSHG